MPVEIPFDSTPQKLLLTVIDGYPCAFDVRWNARDVEGGCWEFDLYEEDLQTLIIADCKIVNGAYYGRECQHQLFRNGIFGSRDTERQQQDAGRNTLGTRVRVYYYTADEIIGGDLRNIQDDAS